MFKLVSWIINLPFTIVGLIIKFIMRGIVRPVRKYVWVLTWHFVYFFLVKPLRLIYLGVAFAGITLIIMAALNDAPFPLPQNIQVAGGNASQQSMASLDSIPVVTGKMQNANSAFATPLMEVMNPTDLQLYSGYFYYAMNHGVTQQPYRWMVSNAFFGEITTEEIFQAKSGSQCRYFNEIISYNGVHERFKGSSCQREDGKSWCKLRHSSALTCGIDKPNGIMLFLKKWF